MEKDLWRLFETICYHIFLALELVLAYLHEPSMQITNWLVDEFEVILPSQRGTVARNPADLLLFMLYMMILTAGFCYILRELWMALRSFMRKVRCRRKRSNEPLLYRQEVPMAQGIAQSPPGQRLIRPAWLPDDWQLEDRSQKPKATRRDQKPVCCFDILGGF